MLYFLRELENKKVTFLQKLNTDRSKFGSLETKYKIKIENEEHEVLIKGNIYKDLQNCKLPIETIIKKKFCKSNKNRYYYILGVI